MEIALIACSGTKKLGGDRTYIPTETLLNGLSQLAYQSLLNARSELADILEYPPGFDIGSGTQTPGLRFYPAYIRYTGNMYSSSQIAELFPRTKSLFIVIISGLYGLLDAYDPI